MRLGVNLRPIRRQLLTLVVIPLVSLIGLWGFATYLTVGDGYRLVNQGRLIDEVAAPAEEILGAIQAERRASVVFLVAPTAANRTTLTGGRPLVDQKIAAFRANLRRGNVQRITPARVMGLAEAELSALDELAALRSEVDERRVDAGQVMDSFRDMVDPMTPLYSAVSTFPDDQISAEGQALQRLAHGRELRARADAVLAGALASGGFTGQSYQEFVAAVGLMRAEYHEAYVEMTDQYRREVDKFFAKDPFIALSRMENAAIATGGSGPIPVSAASWRNENITALAQLSDFQLALAVFVEDHAKPPAYAIFGRIAVAGLLGLIAVILSVLVSLRIGRRLAFRLADLSSSAHALADLQLPAVVERLRRGERVEVDAEAPVLDQSADEIGEVGNAFNSVRRTAIRTAVEQAELRAGIRNVFLNIARRSQTLVKQQLAMLDVMERKTVSPEELADLFKVDHLATRMRRYAENLVILGGEGSARSRGRAVAMQDVLRGAASEAEQYKRVRVLPVPSVVLTGAAVSDVIHLIAELIDNATRYSPPHTAVQVFGQQVPHGFAIEVEDRGLGMTEVDLDAANGWLADPPEFNVLALSETPRLGMFVVARIAARHGIRVALRPSAFGGVTAIALLPPDMVADADLTDEPNGSAGGYAAPGELSAAPAARPGEPSAGSSGEPSGGAGDPDRDRRTAIGAAIGGPPAAPAVEMGGDTVPMPVYRARPSRAPDQPSPADRPRPFDKPRLFDEPRPAGRPAPDDDRPHPAERSAPDRDGAAAQQTHVGLPVRVRQAGLAPGLRDAPWPDPAEAPQSQPVPPRPPEEVRRMMSAYQRGTVRGRQAITGDPEPSSTIDGASTAAAERADEES
jgi:hypothetical protein